MGHGVIRGEEAGFLVGTFLLAGLGVGLAATLMTGWAEASFATEAGGDAARFGPVFVAQLYLSVTAGALVMAPVLAAVLSVLVGSRAFSPTGAAVACGAGSLLGALGYGLLVVTVVVLAKGPAASQAYAFTEGLWPVAGTALVAGVVGAAAGAAGELAG